MTTNFVDRLRAAGIHVTLSICVAGICAAVVFGLWYPGTLSTASGVTTIFLMLLGVDMALGPFITLCIFNRKKPELKRDLAIVGLIQLAALVYGMHTVFIARPVYIVFTVDRFDLVFANDLNEQKLAEASLPEFRTLTYFGPKTASAQLPESTQERNALTFATLSGGSDLQHLPKYYRSYGAAAEQVIARAKPLRHLTEYNMQDPAKVAALVKKYQSNKMEVGFLPLKGKLTDMAVVINKTDGGIAEIVDLRPW